MANDGGSRHCLPAEVTRPDSASAVPGSHCREDSRSCHSSLGIGHSLVIGHWALVMRDTWSTAHDPRHRYLDLEWIFSASAGTVSLCQKRASTMCRASCAIST